MASPLLRGLLSRVLSGARPGRGEGRRPRKPRAARRAAGRLVVERLEDRYVPSTLAPSTLQAISLPAPQPSSDSAAGASDSPSVSADGLYVAFESKAPNLVPGQTGAPDVENVYLLNRMTNQVALVSHVPGSSTAAPTSGLPSYSPIISADGRFVLYGSKAPELAPGLDPSGSVALLYNVQTGQNTLLSHASGSPTRPAGGRGGSANSDPDAISANGRYVLFASNGTDLVPGQGSTSGGSTRPGATWLYLYDTTNGGLQLVDHALGQNNVTDQAGFNSGFIGQDGRVVYAKVGTATVANNGLVAFVDGSNNLVASGMDPGFITSDAYLYDPATQASRVVSFIQGSPSLGAGGVTFGAVISTDGSHVAYVSDDNVTGGITTTVIDNVFVYDVMAQTNTLVSAMAGQTTAGGNANSGAAGLSLAVSGNGQFIAFTSEATNLVPMQSVTPGDNVFLYNSQAPGLTLVSGVSGANSAKNGAGGVPDLTPTGIPTGPPGPSGAAQPIGTGDPITGAEFLGGPQVLSMSGDGGLVAYVSNAASLLPGQSGTLPADNVFVYSRAAGHSTLVSGVNGSATAAAALESSYPALSGNGSLLAFHSQATNLDGLQDKNGVADVFTYSPASPAAAALASRAAFPDPAVPGDSFPTSVSADGRYIVFTSTATNLVPNQVTINSQQNVYLFDSQSPAAPIRLVNHVPNLDATTGDGGVHPLFFAPTKTAAPPDYVQPVISADGSTVAFASFDDNLVANESVPAAEKDQASHPGPVIEFIYLYNVATGTVTLVNHAPGQPATVQAPSANGGIFYDSFHPAISKDGSFVAFAFGQPDGDEVGVALYSRASDSTTIIKADADTNEPVPRAPTISDDGRFVSYLEQGQVYVFDRSSGKSVLASHDNSSPTSTTPANGASSAPVISHDGSAVAFVSAATNLVPGQVASGFTNVFLYQNVFSGHDPAGAIRLVSGVGGSATAGGNGNSDSPAIDLHGDSVAYRSDATNLVAGQTGPAGNVFEFNPQAVPPTQTLVSHQPGSATAGAGGARAPTIDSDGLRESPVNPVIDDDGHLVSYSSTAANLIPGQGTSGGSPGTSNLFVWLRPTNANILASGKGGSDTITGDFDSDAPLLTRGSFPVFTSIATNLVNGIGGTSVAYLNTLVAVTLSPNTVAVGSGAGTVVGSLAVTSAFAGQFLPPTYTLPPAGLNNDRFGLSGAALVTKFAAAAAAGYQVRLLVSAGFGDSPVVIDIFVAVPAPGGGFVGGPPAGGAHPLLAELVSVRVGHSKTKRLMVEVFDLLTGAEVEALVSPFQAPTYRAITLTPLGNGLVMLSARKGKHTVMALLPV